MDQTWLRTARADGFPQSRGSQFGVNSFWHFLAGSQARESVEDRRQVDELAQ
jgi:hypothetical protein